MGVIHFAVMTFGALVLEMWSGGCMFVMPAYFMFLPVALAILALRRICVGTLLFLPYALLGFPPVDSFDWWLKGSL
ncbi:MAG: hypothetical protein NTY23_07145 [Chloroflexi bacterium]|nr:hypothetical protein [Chloroflexota bacterium]